MTAQGEVNKAASAAEFSAYCDAWADTLSSGHGQPGTVSYPSSPDVSRSKFWQASVYSYPDGSFEGSLTPRGASGGGLPRTEEDRANQLEYFVGREQALAWAASEAAAARVHLAHLNIQRAKQRAKVCVRRFVRYHDLRRLVTFTNGAADSEGWTCRREALDDVSGWLKNHRVRFFGDVPVILIAERGGKGGRWHVHGAMPQNGRLPYSDIIVSWSAYMERKGWHSATGKHRWHAGDESGAHRGGFSSARVAARYLVKYITKGMDEDEGTRGEHRYRASGGKLPVAWVGRSPCYETFRVLLTIGSDELIARQCPETGRFRCYSFDCAWGSPPIGLPSGADWRL
ncbi:MAG: hypothetical protein AB2L09_02975 [Coriobacteriia bacterium]